MSTAFTIDTSHLCATELCVEAFKTWPPRMHLDFKRLFWSRVIFLPLSSWFSHFLKFSLFWSFFFFFLPFLPFPHLNTQTHSPGAIFPMVWTDPDPFILSYEVYSVWYCKFIVSFSFFFFSLPTLRGWFKEEIGKQSQEMFTVRNESGGFLYGLCTGSFPLKNLNSNSITDDLISTFFLLYLDSFYPIFIYSITNTLIQFLQSNFFSFLLLRQD